MSGTHDALSPVHQFDTKALRPEEGFAIWRDLFSPIFDVRLPDQDQVGAFCGSLETHHLGGVLLGRCTTVTQVFERNAQTISRSGIDHYLVQLMCSGTSRGVMGARNVTVRTGDVCVMDLGRSIHTIDTDIDALTVCLPRELLTPLVAEPDALHGVVLQGASPLGAMVAGYIQSLQRIVASLSSREARAVARGTTSFIAACLGPAAAVRDLTSRPMEVTRVIAIKRHIDAHLGDPELGPGSISAAFEVSRPTLYRMFEPMGGVVAYILQRRLARSLADLMSLRQQRVADVARRWGFGSETTFSRAFRAAYGISPRDAQAGVWPVSRTATDGPEDFKAWVKELAGI